MGKIAAALEVGGHAVSAANRVPVELVGEVGPYVRAVQMGDVSGSRILEQHANVSLATGLTRNIWSRGNTANQPLQTSTVSLEIVSSSASDAAAGTGARTVFVEGLDGNFARKFDTYTMDGTNAVSMGSGWLRINNAYVVTAGSAQINVGTLSIQIASGGTIQAQLPGSWGVINQICYTAPAGKNTYLLHLSFASMGDTQVQTLVTGTSTKTLPLLSTTLIGFYGDTGATAEDLVYRQRHRLFAYRGGNMVCDFGFNFLMSPKGVYAPSAQNTTADTIEFVANAIFLEEDA